jgi:hypothetical protein
MILSCSFFKSININIIVVYPLIYQNGMLELLDHERKSIAILSQQRGVLINGKLYRFLKNKKLTKFLYSTN